MAFADSVETLLAKGSVKFGKVCTMIVLEEDGSEVDEDEILMEVSNRTLLLLAEGERWNKPGTVVTDVASNNSRPNPTQSTNENTVLVTQSTQSTNENTVLVPPPIVIESTNHASQDKSMSLPRTVHVQNSNINIPLRTNSPNHVDRIAFGGRNIYVSGEINQCVPTTTATPTFVSSAMDMMTGHFCTSENDMGLEVSHYNSSVSSPAQKIVGILDKDDIPLPPFSRYVMIELQKGNATKVWRRMIDEAACFYVANRPSLSDGTEYRKIGSMMYKCFPCIAQDQGASPWSLFTKNLSQKIRHMRWANKRRTQQILDEPPEKRPMKEELLSPNQNSVDSYAMEAMMSEEEYEKNLQDLQMEWSKPLHDDKVIKNLLRETFQYRKRLMSCGISLCEITQILEDIPCFKDGNYVLYEYSLILGKPKLIKIFRTLDPFMSNIEILMNNGNKKQGDLRMLPIILYTEDNTEYDKGHKGQSVVQVLNNLNDDVLDQYLDTAELDPPRLIILTLNNMALKRAFVVGHGMIVECKVKNVAEALLVLLATYSVWNLDYPKEYCQALYFFKIALLGESYVDMQYMSSKFRLLLKEYHSKFGIEMEDAPAAADALNGVLSSS